MSTKRPTTPLTIAKIVGSNGSFADSAFPTGEGVLAGEGAPTGAGDGYGAGHAFALHAVVSLSAGQAVPPLFVFWFLLSQKLLRHTAHRHSIRKPRNLLDKVV
jgi:hypothetical protein